MALWHLSAAKESRVVTRSSAFAGGKTAVHFGSGDGAGDKGAVIDGEVCEKCGHNQAYFKTAQLRSVDEGQTVFFECTKCGHQTKENT